MGITEKGTLPIGVEFEGKLHREFEIREQFVKDSVEVLEDKDNSARAASSDSFFSVCILSKKLVRLGDIPADRITPALIMGMLQEDFNEINSASKRLEERRRRFREEAEGASPDDNSAP